GRAIVSERLLRLLVPADLPAEQGMGILRTILGLPLEGDLRLPPAISMPLGLMVATASILAIAAMLGSALAELVALQSRPADVLVRERRRAARVREDAEVAPATGPDQTDELAGPE